MGFVVPCKTTAYNGVTEGENITKVVGVNGVARRESSGDVGA